MIGDNCIQLNKFMMCNDKLYITNTAVSDAVIHFQVSRNSPCSHHLRCIGADNITLYATVNGFICTIIIILWSIVNVLFYFWLVNLHSCIKPLR